MKRYEDTFETLATRGTPIGATALLERVDYELSYVVLGSPPRRRLSGLAVATVVFAVVLAVGALWALLILPGGDVADDPGIEWIELGNVEGVIDSVTAGPGGFVRSGFLVAAGGPGLEFSSDGRAWSDVELPGLRSRSAVRSVETTGDAWLVMVTDGHTVDAWASPDGRVWTPVVWPGALGETISEVVGSGDGFLAVSRDVFGAGTTLWWSPDGAEWSELDNTGPGDPDRAGLWGTAGGIVWFPSVDDRGSTSPIYHSIDGSTWTEGLIELPAELAGSPTQWNLGIVEHVSGQWIAIGEVSRTGADPVLHVWTSRDGIEWTSQGIPEFGLVDDRAVTVSRSAVIADRLVVSPAVVPLFERDDGIVTGAGEVISSGEVWATDDGASWTRVLRADAEIAAVAGRATNGATTIGVWVGRPPSGDEQPVVATTAPPVEPQDLDQAGLDLQLEILADGGVTRDEFEQALEGWKACMEERGFVHVTFEIDPGGGWSSGYASPSPDAGEAEDAACLASYVNDVADAL